MSKTNEVASKFEPAGKSREWNFHPALPISVSPVFDIPPRPKAALAWLFGTWLFKNVHYLHHRNINVGPWSGLAMHPVEHAIYYSGILIHFLLPSHPIHVIFHMFALNLGAVFSHSGFDKLLVRDKEAIEAGSFHHQLHHRYFECNYGSEEIPLDRWFGSFHDGTREATEHIRARKKRIFAGK